MPLVGLMNVFFLYFITFIFCQQRPGFESQSVGLGSTILLLGFEEAPRTLGGGWSLSDPSPVTAACLLEGTLRPLRAVESLDPYILFFCWGIDHSLGGGEHRPRYSTCRPIHLLQGCLPFADWGGRLFFTPKAHLRLRCCAGGSGAGWLYQTLLSVEIFL